MWQQTKKKIPPMLTKTLHINQEEIKKNEDALSDFQFSFLTKNLKRIGELLAPRGDFFGKHTATEAKAKLHQMMHQNENEDNIFSHITLLGFSFDSHPGQTVIEFRNPNLDSETFMSYPREDELFGKPPMLEFNETVMRIALKIQNGKITMLRFPTKVVPTLQKYMYEN
jgi:hypothetical protein